MSDVSSPNSDEPPPLPKRGRSSEDFLSFCKLILDYENYDGELVRERHTSSPLGSTGDSSLSSFHDETYHEPSHQHHHHHHLPIQDVSDGDTMTDDLDDDDSEITCYCRKPYGGRPMIECSSCQTWVHLTCAKVKRNNIPETWYCRFCRFSAKSSKGGAKSRARKPQLGRKHRSGAATAVILTKNKPRL